MRKIYVVGNGWSYTQWMQGDRIHNMKDADLVVFTGGEDIDPKLYNRRAHQYTNFNEDRDRYEVAAFKEAKILGKKLIGICRGAQLFCAMAGGILVQDSRHPNVHSMVTQSGKKIWVTSAHHQRQYPFVSHTGHQVKYEILGYSENLSAYNFGESDRDKLLLQPEVEVAIYPEINALAIQSHPEWAYPAANKWQKEFIDYCRKT